MTNWRDSASFAAVAMKRRQGQICGDDAEQDVVDADGTRASSCVKFSRWMQGRHLLPLLVPPPLLAPLPLSREPRGSPRPWCVVSSLRILSVSSSMLSSTPLAARFLGRTPQACGCGGGVPAAGTRGGATRRADDSAACARRKCGCIVLAAVGGGDLATVELAVLSAVTVG